MNCPRCHYDCPPDFGFCPECGTALQQVCTRCGFQAPPDFAFCPKCGTPLAAAAPAAPAPAPDMMVERMQRLVPKEFAERLLTTRGQVGKERRMVTILFSDVKGSTAMAEKLDPEEWVEVMDGAFDVLIEPVYRYEGTLARLMGDAILAFFGAPIAHEDDPERACRAALEIIEGAQRYAARLEEERGIRGFNVRVGINTGLVVVGVVGSDLRVEYTAMGDAVNLAARMESAAEPGTILVTEETHKLIAPLFETEALGPIQVKGKAQPVPVYRVLAPKLAPSKPRGIAGLESPLVGREAELGALREAVERLRAGVGGIVTIVGEAGIGKSRLVAEIRRDVPAGCLYWVEGRCLSYGTSIAYLLWLDALRALLEVSPEDTPVVVRDKLRDQVQALRLGSGQALRLGSGQALRLGSGQALCPGHFQRVYPCLGRLMSLPLASEDAEALRDLEGEQLKAGTFHAVGKLIECTASERPLVVVCEDLHWADPTSIELLEQLLALTDRAPLLFICVFRPVTEHGCWRLRETIARDYRHRHTDLWLDPLSTSESETLVGNLLRIEELPQQLKERILSHAEGNPFYMEEVIRSLIDTEAIVQDEATGRWQATRDVVTIPIPDTLQGVLMARIDRLQEEAKRVLQLASVIGRIFLYRVLAAIAQAERELYAHLVTLQREEMIRERARVPELEYIFKHDLTREAAYNSLLKKERRLFHRRVAEALEQLFPERIEEQAGLLAHHWLRATEEEKAIPYLLKAGDQARALYAHAEAERFYQQAVRLLRGKGQDELAARTLMKLGLVYTAAFEPEKAREAYDEAFSLWEPLRKSRELPELRLPGAVLRFAVAEPLSLDPAEIGDDVSTFIAAQLFEGLVEVDPDYNVLPAMAARWEVADRGTRYVFHLREGLRWNDGAPMTATDFEYAWKRNLTLASRSPVPRLLYVIKNARAFGEGEINDPEKVGVMALDDLTLEVRLEEPTAYLPHLLAHTIACPLPRWALQGHGQPWTDPGNLVSNGAYQLVEWEPGEKLVLSRNPFYRGRFPGNVERAECPVFTDFVPILESYAADTLDAVSMITADPGTTARARAAHGRELVFTPQLSTFHLVFRVDRPPFDDVRVRQAFVHAVDREALAREAWQGQRLPATGGVVPPGMPGHSTGIGLAYDPDRARRLLAQAGYPGGQGFPTVIWLYSGGSADEPVVPFLRKAWRKNLGLKLEAQSLGWGAFIERRDRDPAHLTLGGWGADYPDPDCFLRVAFHSTEGINRPGWHDTRFDALVEEAARVADQTMRMELYQEADRILVAEEAVIMPLSYGRGRMLVKPWVTLPRVPPVLVRLKHIVVQREEH